MTGKKSLLFSLRLFFVLFTLQFIKISFYRWDGFSYFMDFLDFIHDLSFAFIIWTLSALVAALIFWLFSYWIITKILSFKKINFEFITVSGLFVALITFVQRGFFPDLSLYLKTVVLIVSISLFLYFVFKYINHMKVLLWVDSHITPLFWLFAVLFIVSIPLSITTYGSLFENNGKPVPEKLESSKEKPVNIILVTMDSLTAANMQVYGYERPTTPFISAWSENTVVFKRFYSSSNWTTPSAMSMMTGQRPWTHRLWYEAYFHQVEEREHSLPEILSKHGYYNYGYVQNNLAHPKTLGIAGAFSELNDAYTFLIPDNWFVKVITKFYVKRRVAAELVLDHNPLLKPFNIKHARHPAYMRQVLYSSSIRSETVYNRFLDFITVNKDKPFFAWIHVFPPHDLYLPPVEYIGKFGDADKYNTGEQQLDSNLLYAEYSSMRQSDVDILKKRYDEFILYSDQQFKLFIDQLSKTVDMSNTVIILSSDHGESFSHGYVAHNGSLLYESLVRVPLIIKMPENDNGRVIEMPVEQIDLAPTILDLAGISVPKWMDGRSLKPLLEGLSLEPRPLFSMQLIKNRASGNNSIRKGTIAVWDRDYKLIDYLDEENGLLLFDLSSDPNEEQNLVDEKPEIASRLKKLIDDNLFLANIKITE